MSPEGVFSRQDAAPTPGPTSDAGAASLPSGIPEGEPLAPPQQPAPGPSAGEPAPTPDQISEWRRAYENRQEWQRANTQEAQRIAREREQIQGYKQWIDDLQYGYQNDARVREFIDEYNKRFIAGEGQPTEPTGGVPQPGQQPAADPILAQRLAAAEQRLEQFERARDAEWADKAYASAESEFQKITGRGWTPQEFMRLRHDLASTGSIDPTAQLYWTFRNEFAQVGNRQAQENVLRAQTAASGAQVEGVAGGNQAQQIDLRTADDATIDRIARQAIGAEAPQDYSPYIWTKPK